MRTPINPIHNSNKITLIAIFGKFASHKFLNETDSFVTIPCIIC